jgi:hypothetical protein
MKITEVTKPSDKALFESLDHGNDTGFATEDLVKIHRQHNSDKWEPASYEDLMAEIDALMELDENE